jgi:hypothetical protein
MCSYSQYLEVTINLDFNYFNRTLIEWMAKEFAVRVRDKGVLLRLCLAEVSDRLPRYLPPQNGQEIPFQAALREERHNNSLMPVAV